MAFTDPIKWDSKILLAKLETTEGTDPTPTGAANAILAKNIEFRPMEGEDESRDLERPYGGAQEDIPVGLHCAITFDVELAGSGDAGTPPLWGPLMRMCRCAEAIVVDTSVEYTPITDAAESGTIYFMIGTTLHKMLGTRGTFELTLNAQRIPIIRFSLRGLYGAPSTAARPTPDLTGFTEPLVATKANTPAFEIGGTPMILRDFTFRKANDVQNRFLIGSERVVIVNSDESLSVQVEAVPIATYNPYAKAVERTKQEIVLTHGLVAGNIATLAIAKAQQKRLSGFANANNALEWPLEFKALPDEGNDQFSLLLT